ncbi:MAG TPA: hypothetical protein PLS53_15230 [Thermoanaerobaculaceae bacterium]|nr:hypothetical protein [Thermoanaerobaculaceae bacterium]HPS79511.1 hypothetical protein [Thermoanaerobaculaceae bacterium]
MWRWVVLTVALAAPATAGAQAVSEWRTSGGLPLVVVQMPGGDLEHLAVVLPAEARPPDRLAGEAVQVTPRRLAQIVSVSPSELRLGPVVSELLGALRSSGATALVAAGPLPARDLEGLLEAAEDVPWRPLPRLRCPAVDGTLETLAGSPERVELELGLPGPTDPRLALVPSLVRWIEQDLRPVLAGARGELDLSGGCARLLLRVPAGELPAREALYRLRAELAALSLRTPSPEELEAVRAAGSGRAGRQAIDTAAVAREVVEWVSLGGLAATVLSDPPADGPALAAFAREVLAGHAGRATVVETERRPRPQPSESLENGALLSVGWLPGELAIVGLALGGLDPHAGAAVLDGAAGAAAERGWSTRRLDVLGVPALALAVRAGEASEAMELVTDSVRGPQPPAVEGIWGEAMHAVGLAASPTAEAVSLAARLPIDAEEGAEAARKFLGELPPGSVRVGAAGGERRLVWTPGPEAATILALADIEPSATGALAVTILQMRAAEFGVELHPLAPTGRLVVALVAGGEKTVPALDARGAVIWKRLLRSVEAPELLVATGRTLNGLLGDLAVQTARLAARPFLPADLSEVTLRAVTAGDITRVLGGLPPWTELRRFARGPAPVVAPVGSVRRSPPGAPVTP